MQVAETFQNWFTRKLENYQYIILVIGIMMV